MAGVAAVVLSGCSMGTDLPLAGGAIDAFHQALNNGDFHGIYAASSPEMRRAASESDLTKLLAAVHRKLGLFQSGKMQGFQDSETTSGHFVIERYAAKYAQGDASETFTYRIDGARASLAGYNINSTALIEG